MYILVLRKRKDWATISQCHGKTHTVTDWVVSKKTEVMLYKKVF